MFINNYHYIPLSCALAYINVFCITYLSIIYFAYAVNNAQFLYITFLAILFTVAPAAAVLLTDIFLLTSIYASL